MRVELWEECHVIICSPKEEAVVHMTLPCCEGELLFECLECRGLGNGVGHVEIGGHAPSCSCTALTVDVGFLRQARLTEMHMVVDDTRQHKTARSIDDLIKRIKGTGRSILTCRIMDLFP